MFDPLILDAPPESAWLAFVGDGAGAGRRAPARHAPVLAQWQRSLSLGAPPDGPRPEDVLDRGAALRTRLDQLEPLLVCGQGVLGRIGALAAQHDYALLLADLDGVIVHASGGGAFATEAHRVRLMAGADWSERARGTNAIGTALAEQRPVFVHGGAHFARPYHELVCYAAPVRGPDGRVLAVLDATSVRHRAEASIGFGVLAAAQALEEVLRLRAYSQAGAAVMRAIVRSLERMSCPVALVEPPGRLSRMNAAARELLAGRAARGGADEVRHLLGLGYDELAMLATAASGDATVEVASPCTGRRHRLRVEPIESEGRPIALLCFVEAADGAVGAIAAPVRGRPAPSAASARAMVGAGGGEPGDPFPELFRRDPALDASLRTAARFARSELPVMLLAETGSGKDLVARGIHALSPRRAGPFVAVNCASIAASLFESELFGYGPGAFTGAARNGHHGYLHSATGGTLFLDEVAEMPLAMQAALLRVLEDGSYRRVGETAVLRADVRVVCATCRDLPAMVERGEFRKDLFFRLKGVAVSLPPLRERTDAAALARHLLDDLAARRGVATPLLHPDVVALIERQRWPGNVRELKSSLDVALVLAGDADVVGPEHLPADLVAAAGDAIAAPATAPSSEVCDASDRSFASAEGTAVRRALREADGNLSRAARTLGVARSTLYRMMRRHGLDVGDAAQG